MGADCSTDQYLVVAKFMEKLAVSRLGVEMFNRED
jgi:hypothetical protein